MEIQPSLWLSLLRSTICSSLTPHTSSLPVLLGLLLPFPWQAKPFNISTHSSLPPAASFPWYQGKPGCVVIATGAQASSSFTSYASGSNSAAFLSLLVLHPIPQSPYAISVTLSHSWRARHLASRQGQVVKNKGASEMMGLRIDHGVQSKLSLLS